MGPEDHAREAARLLALVKGNVEELALDGVVAVAAVAIGHALLAQRPQSDCGHSYILAQFDRAHDALDALGVVPSSEDASVDERIEALVVPSNEEAPSPAEDRVPDLLGALEDSVTKARAARERQRVWPEGEVAVPSTGEDQSDGCHRRYCVLPGGHAERHLFGPESDEEAPE